MFVYVCLQHCYWFVNSCCFDLNDVGRLFLMIYKYDLELYLATGPSYSVDSACSSSMYALEHAYTAIRSGLCDSAIVGGSSLCLHPYVSLSFFRLGVTSNDGICRAFDKDGMQLSSVRHEIIFLL
jgi:hypothetical protein